MKDDKPSPAEILRLLASHLDLDSIRAKHPNIEKADVKDALLKAASLLESKSPRPAASSKACTDLPESGWVVNIDGASRGNPGPAASAAFIRTPNGVFKLKKTLGMASNNIAEYSALIMTLESAIERKVDVIEVRSDSELMVKQINGQYKVKHPNLVPLYKTAKNLEKKFKSFKIVHVRREQNAEADAIANEALDEAMNRC